MPLVLRYKHTLHISRTLAFFASMAFLLFTSLAVALPPPMLAEPGISWRPAPSTQSTCDPSTYTPSSTDPADWRECASLYSAWTAQNGTFVVAGTGGFVPILHVSDCTFSVRVVDPSSAPVILGDRDVRAFLDVSLKDYSRGTDLGVVGTAECRGKKGMAGVDWRISKS